MDVSVSVCDNKNQSTIEKPHYVSDLSKADALLHKTRIKVLLVPRLNISSISKIALQM